MEIKDLVVGTVEVKKYKIDLFFPVILIYTFNFSGSLTWTHGGEIKLIGVLRGSPVVGKYVCGKYPSIWSRVTYFLDWIEDNTGITPKTHV